MIEVNLIPHFSPQKQQLGSFLLITDITDRWQAESTVRQSEERMRKFTEITDEAILFHRDGLITDGNDALTRLTGYTLPEVMGLSIFNFISHEWRAVAYGTRAGREDPMRYHSAQGRAYHPCRGGGQDHAATACRLPRGGGARHHGPQEAQGHNDTLTCLLIAAF